MRRRLLPCLNFSVIVSVLLVGAQRSAAQEKAVTALEKLGGKIEVIKVDLGTTKINDADLIHLQDLANLQTLIDNGRGVGTSAKID